MIGVRLLGEDVREEDGTSSRLQLRLKDSDR